MRHIHILFRFVTVLAAVVLGSFPSSAALPQPTGAAFAKGAKLTVAKYTGSEPFPGFRAMSPATSVRPAGRAGTTSTRPTSGLCLRSIPTRR